MTEVFTEDEQFAAAILRQAVLEMRRVRGRLEKVTVNDYALTLRVIGLAAPADGWQWQCAGCQRPVPPMGMCETCGVFGIMRLVDVGKMHETIG